MGVSLCSRGKKKDEGEEKKSRFISEREREEKKRSQIIRYKVIVTLCIHICTVIITSLDIYKIIQGLICVFFILYCVKFYTFYILDSLIQVL